jgi:hypothetical protein
MTGYFADLEQELAAALERSGTPWPRSVVRGRRGRLLALAAALIATAGVPAAAMTVFRSHREADGLVRLSERRVIATGTTPGGRRWQLLASQSSSGFCFGIKLGSEGPSEGCGGSVPGSLSVATRSGGSISQDALVFGLAPEQAAQVRVQADGAATSVDTIDDNAGLDGRLYVAELPVRTALHETVVQALDHDGEAIATKQQR